MSFILKAFYQVEVHGLSHIPPSGPCLLVCNHLSYLDWMLIYKFSPRPVHFIIHHKFYDHWAFHHLLKKVNAIPIAGGNSKPKLIVEAFQTVSKNLNKGHLVLIFPEGGITRLGRLEAFQKGVLRIKKNSPEAKLVPVSISGLWGSLFSYSSPGVFSLRKARFKKRKIRINFHPALQKDLTLPNLREVILSKLDVNEHHDYDIS